MAFMFPMGAGGMGGMVPMNSAGGEDSSLAILLLVGAVAAVGVGGFILWRKMSEPKLMEKEKIPDTPPPSGYTRDKCGKFDESFYYRLHPDVKKAGVKAWDHYKSSGYKEGRAACTAGSQCGQFSPDYYLWLYPDVVNAGAGAWPHYAQSGYTEGRELCVTGTVPLPPAAIHIGIDVQPKLPPALD